MPSRCTVHAPQRATPQPNLVPFIPRRSRKTHSNGMSGDALTVWDSPLIFNVTMIDLPTHVEKWSISTRPRTKSNKGQPCASQQNSCVNDSYWSFAPFWLYLDVWFAPNNDRMVDIRKRSKRAL